jgi:hypothetical protein
MQKIATKKGIPFTKRCIYFYKFKAGKMKCESPFKGGTYINEFGLIRAPAFTFLKELKP